MKNKSITLLSLLLLSSCGTGSMATINTKDALTIDEVSSKVVQFFSSSYSVDSTVYNTYSKETFHAIDMVSSMAKTNAVYNSDGEIISYTSIVNDNGYAMEQYLSLSNTLETRNISSSKVSFKDNYGSPLSKIMGSVASINEHFTISSDDEAYYFTANEKGLAKAASIFGTFFTFYGDVYQWDAKSVQDIVQDLIITCDANGEPVSLSFTKIKKDRFGGIKETYQSKLSSISSVSGIPTVECSDSLELQNALKQSLSSLSEKVEKGNFTQTINHPYTDEYHNYYSFDEDWNGGMLCDIQFDTKEYGPTYLGLGYSSFYGYYMAGVSPESDYVGAASNQYFNTVSEVLPQIQTLSNTFFTYDLESKEYIFDLDDFFFDDYYFCFSILDCLFGSVDPLADKLGYYLSNTSNYAMDFHTLSISINEETGLPTFSLNYTDYYNNTLTVSTSFGEFGTTDLSTNETLSYAYELLLGGNE